MVELKEVAKQFKADHLTRPLIKYFYYYPSIWFSWLAISLNIHAHFVNLFGLITAIGANKRTAFAGKYRESLFV